MPRQLNEGKEWPFKQIVLMSMAIHVQKKEVGHLKLHTKMMSKWIMGLHIKFKRIRVLEENIEFNSSSPYIRQWFLKCGSKSMCEKSKNRYRTYQN